ncbi:hypothetical protein N2152v2_008721 [Parachlorella kessleri]
MVLATKPSSDTSSPTIDWQLCDFLAQVTEERVIERIEVIADPLKDEGEWVAKVDLVEEGSKLMAKEMAELGECGVECKTLQRAVQDILDEHDTDIAEALFVGKKSRAKFSNWLCYELTSSCKSKPPPLPKDRQPGPAFKPADAEKVKMDRMLAGMQAQGMRGNLYSRDEAIAKYMQEQGGGDGDDDDAPYAAPTEDPDTGSSDGEHPVNRLANTALEKGSEILGKAKEAAGPLLEGAAAGIEKAKEEARKLWDKFQAEPATKEGKAESQIDSGEL